MNEKHSYSFFEKILIFMAIGIFSFMGYAYFMDISIKKLLFPGAEDKLLQTPIAKVAAMTGTANRQRASEFEFKALALDNELYLNDTITTGPDSTLTIMFLKDGSKIELAPNSLVKLTFGSDFSVTGVVHVEVIKGSKTDETEENKLPIAITNTSPPNKTTFEFTTEEFNERKKTVQVSFAVSRKTARVTVHVFLPEGGGHPRKEVSSIAPSLDNLNASAAFTFNGPGAYEWEVHDLQGKVLARNEFELGHTIKAIQSLPTLNNTNRLEGLATKKSFDGFVLRWKPIPGPGDYLIRVYKADTNTVILQKRMTANELILNKNNLLLGRLQYVVEKDLGNGFIATSGKQDFGFVFLPPELTAPQNNTRFTPQSLYETNNIIFFTWTKTNYTEGYQFQLASDPAFKSIKIDKTIRDNYMSHPAPIPGRYFWRVRSLANGIWSDFGAVRSFEVALQ